MKEATLVLMKVPVVSLLTPNTAVHHLLTPRTGDTAAFLQSLEAEIAVGLTEGSEEGGDVGLVHHHHIPRVDLLLGHHVATLGLGDLDVHSTVFTGFHGDLKVHGDVFVVGENDGDFT